MVDAAQLLGITRHALKRRILSQNFGPQTDLTPTNSGVLAGVVLSPEAP
ncbi:MAG: hypothetical protein IPK80_27205 [Nannocystis sp.]|nr:hypothetical protein [Nannocystis sp.]